MPTHAVITQFKERVFVLENRLERLLTTTVLGKSPQSERFAEFKRDGGRWPRREGFGAAEKARCAKVRVEKK
jgi:hypothetical protein